MAYFIGTIDPSADRRAVFVERARRALESSHGSPAQTFERADLAIVSWSADWEPFRRADSEDGTGFIWGHAIEREHSVADSPDLVERWRNAPQPIPAPLEGIHAALLHRADGSWVAGADLLGLMPLYYCSGKDHVLIGSTPELFRAHPSFVPRLSPKGLAGILLTNGLVEGNALLQGIQRLGAGNLLIGEPQAALREVAQYRPEVSDRYFGASFDENYRRLEEVLEDCFRRHLGPAGSYGLILSGGLDSRLMAGLMTERGVRPTSYSFGSRHDIEIKCAAAVTKHLALEHHIVPVPMQSYAQHAASECRWKHLANGFGNVLFHEPIAATAKTHGGMLSGYEMESIIGCDHITWAGRDPSRMSFETYCKKLYRWGIPPQIVKQLLSANFDASVVDEVVENLEQAYNARAEREFQKAWLFGLGHRARYHVSAVLGLHSRWPWPVVPYIDSKMLDLMGGMPFDHVVDRRMQYHMIKMRFPNLARLPIDRNSFNMKPFVARHGRVVNHLLFKPRELAYRWTRRIRDRRFYYRAMDFDSTGWRAVRAAAEPHRASAARVLDSTTLDSILPKPNESVAVPDRIIDASKMRLLTGVLLWLANYPPHP